MICVNLLKYTAFALNLFQIENKSLTRHSFNTTSSLIYKLFTINLPHMFSKLLKNYMFTYNWSRIYVTLSKLPLVYHIFATNLPLIWVTLLQHHELSNNLCQLTSIHLICHIFIFNSQLMCRQIKSTNNLPLIATNLLLIYNSFTHILTLIYIQISIDQ